MEFEQRVKFIEDLNTTSLNTESAVSFEIANDADPILATKGQKKILLSQRNFFYAWDLQTQFDYYFSAIVPEERDGFSIADFSEPRWHRLSATGERFYFTSFAEGWAEAQAFIEYLKPAPGETVLDLGAYCGLSAVTFARAVGPTGRVISFEPDPDNWKALELNINGKYPNIQLVNKAVWGEPRSLWFSCEGNMGSQVLLEPSGNRDKLVEVLGTNLEQIQNDHGLEKIDVVKMDIEGSEYDALEASREFIRRNRARWFVEIHADPSFDNKHNIDRVRKVFDACDYMSHQINKNPKEDYFFSLLYAQPRD